MENNQKTPNNQGNTGHASNHQPTQDGNRKESDPKMPTSDNNPAAQSDNKQQPGFNKQQDQQKDNATQRQPDHAPKTDRNDNASKEEREKREEEEHTHPKNTTSKETTGNTSNDTSKGLNKTTL